MITGIADGKLPPVLVAKNGKARSYIESTLSLEGLAVEDARAEDIPWLVAEELPQYLGLTTTEYLAEYKLKTGKSTSLVFYRIEWKDSECVFGKPCIAAIGRRDSSEEKLFMTANSIIVAIRKSTELLGKDLALSCASFYDYYKRSLNQPSLELDFKVFTGDVEMAVSKGKADLAIEVVSTGRTVREKFKGLEIYAPLFGIDLALVANKNYLSQLRG